MQSYNQIRQQFIDYFKSKGHHFVPSSPMVVKNDPTLMFTNAGMNQFKDIFLGNKTSEYTRVVNSQKCLRVSGKHNDLEEVGLDGYHHTFFEMLGNWSFGDYFKENAIEWAWELLTMVYKIPKDRLYVTVFQGDKQDNLNFDEEAKRLWEKYVQASHIIPASKKDNFWEMGDVGPCGPCSEIHVDIRSEEERKKVKGEIFVNKDHPQVIEIWNLVFIQFNRLSDGSLEQLPKKHVDTGMGFERLCMVLQAKQNNYDTDIFASLIEKIASFSNTKIKSVEQESDFTTISLRVIADHVRAVTFAIADGLMPSNNKAGYVIRRILRRAVRYGFTFLGMKQAFIYQLVPLLGDLFIDIFPEVSSQKQFIMNVIEQEEEAFLRTLDRGLKKLEELTTLDKRDKTISGKDAFELYDTYGFPLDLTILIANEKHYSVDEDGFRMEMQGQKNRSRASAELISGDWITVQKGDFLGFVGYDQYVNSTKVLKYRVSKNDKHEKKIQVILEETPFYAESGGQVGDIGQMIFGDEEIKVLDTKKENDTFIHFVESLPSNIDKEVIAKINTKRRFDICVNHTSTHLMHAALKQVLGSHIEQKGSLVNDKELRFDFNHYDKVSREQIDEITNIVNIKINERIKLEEKRNIPIKEAKEMGATALFGEKYGNFVRVITFDEDFSRELCGGTHVKNTFDIGTFQIISEGSVATGIRRITAISGIQALSHYQDVNSKFESVRQMLNYPKDVIKAIQSLQDDQKKLQKKIDQLFQKQKQQLVNELVKKAISKDSTHVIIENIDASDADMVKSIAFTLDKKLENAIIVLCANIQTKANLTILINKGLVQSRHLNAASLIKEWSPYINGGGGGQPFYAVAGGGDVQGLQKVIALARELFIEN